MSELKNHKSPVQPQTSIADFDRRSALRAAVSAGLAAIGGSALLAGCGGGEEVADERESPMAKKGQMDVPSLFCAAATATSIYLGVATTGGGTGAPAGFSVQWMRNADFEAGGKVWPSSDTAPLCKASFSGNANLSRWTLPVGGEANGVWIGALNDGAAGVSFTCNEPLECNTAYVFRVFVHATSTLRRSDFTADFVCSTAAC